MAGLLAHGSIALGSNLPDGNPVSGNHLEPCSPLTVAGAATALCLVRTHRVPYWPSGRSIARQHHHNQKARYECRRWSNGIAALVNEQSLGVT